MNIWENAVITNKGLALQSKLTQGTSLAITRAVAGAGYVSPALLLQQTAVLEPKQELKFASASYPEEGKCAVPVYLNNEGLETGYTAKQVGFYATDPDEGEVLYFICQSDKGTDIPSETEMPGYNAEWTFYFQYGQADNVSVTVDPANTVNAAQVQQMIDEAVASIPTPDVSGQINDHNTDGSAHADIRTALVGAFGHQGYGNFTGDLNDFITFGSAMICSDVANRPANTSLYGTVWNIFGNIYAGYLVQNYLDAVSRRLYYRTCIDGTWGVWNETLHTGNKDQIFTYGTEDLVAGETPLETGKLYFVYE